MTFTASTTDYVFDTWKVKIDESNLRRSLHQTMINKKGEFKKIGVSYSLEIEFFDMSETDKTNLNIIFNDDFGDFTVISSIDEVQSGEVYDKYEADVYIAKPKELLIWRRTTPRKQLNNWKTKITVICTTKTTPTKP